MRLIDADRALEIVLDQGIAHPNAYHLTNYATLILREAPTIEAEPVRHGYWENANGRPKTYIRKCSVCSKEAYFCGRGCSYKYCPNCGEKMDGGADKE